MRCEKLPIDRDWARRDDDTRASKLALQRFVEHFQGWSNLPRVSFSFIVGVQKERRHVGLRTQPCIEALLFVVSQHLPHGTDRKRGKIKKKRRFAGGPKPLLLLLALVGFSDAASETIKTRSERNSSSTRNCQSSPYVKARMPSRCPPPPHRIGRGYERLMDKGADGVSVIGMRFGVGFAPTRLGSTFVLCGSQCYGAFP